MSATASGYLQMGNCAGVCVMPFMFFGNYPLIELLNAVTGWGLDVTEALATGARIQTLRQSFNLREGIQAADVRLPDRMAGRPPLAEGPLAGVAIDVDSLAREYRTAMGWMPGCADEGTLDTGLAEFQYVWMKLCFIESGGIWAGF
jgi:aldehyde:ferredoxin oxidoreductase